MAIIEASVEFPADLLCGSVVGPMDTSTNCTKHSRVSSLTCVHAKLDPANVTRCHIGTGIRSIRLLLVGHNVTRRDQCSPLCPTMADAFLRSPCNCSTPPSHTNQISRGSIIIPLIFTSSPFWAVETGQRLCHPLRLQSRLKKSILPCHTGTAVQVSRRNHFPHPLGQ